MKLNTNDKRAIKAVLSPTMYQRMLVQRDASCICSNCLATNLRCYINSCYMAYSDNARYELSVLAMETVDGGVHCDDCGSHISEYED